MISPRIDHLLENVDGRDSHVIAAPHRAPRGGWWAPYFAARHPGYAD